MKTKPGSLAARRNAKAETAGNQLSQGIGFRRDAGRGLMGNGKKEQREHTGKAWAGRIGDTR